MEQGDAISRSALAKKFEECPYGIDVPVFEMLYDAPALDVVPAVHAHWVYDPDGMDYNLGAWLCSECKVKNDNLGGLQRINPYRFSGSRYCPNCGAKMDALRKDDVPLPEPPKEGDDGQPDGL